MNVSSNEALNKEIPNQPRISIRKKLQSQKQGQVKAEILMRDYTKKRRDLGGAEDKMSVQIEVVRSDGGGAAVVALDTADGDDGVGLLLHGVGH